MAETNNLEERIAGLCNEAIRGQVFPGCQVGYVREGGTRILSFGHLTYEAGAPAVTEQTVYDVASITKSIPTSSIILKLAEDGRLSLTDRVIDFIPEMSNEYRDKILIKHLLTFMVMFKTGTLADLARRSPDQLLETILAAALAAPPGEQYFYTNTPSLLLGIVAERVCGKPLDTVAQTMFFQPLGMTNTTFHVEAVPIDEIAPTGIDSRGEIRGRIHDPSARVLYRAGQIPGHAGLFSTASDLMKFAGMLIGRGMSDGQRFFDAKTVEAMHKNQIRVPGEKTGLGWTIKNPAVMGTTGSTEMFGKTGFTGTMILMDPVKKMALVVLSNRTYPQTPESYEPMRAIWRGLADLVFEG